MSKSKLVLLFLIITAAIFLITPYIIKIFDTASCDLNPFFENAGKYNWLFKKDSRDKINRFYSIGNSETNEFVYGYTYDNKYRYIIRELKVFNNLTLKKVLESNQYLNQKVYFDVSTDFELGIGPRIKVRSKTCLTRINNIKITFDSIDSIGKIELSDAVLYKGQFGQFDITDENDEYQIYVRFTETYLPESYLILLKKADSFFIILVNSIKNEYPLDESIKLLDIN